MKYSIIYSKRNNTITPIPNGLIIRESDVGK